MQIADALLTCKINSDNIVLLFTSVTNRNHPGVIHLVNILVLRLTLYTR